MNKATAKRLISKQEAAVLLGNLDLTLSTETIENVSISNSVQLQKVESTGKGKSVMDRYRSRGSSQESMSLHDYFHFLKNPDGRNKRGAIIPHFVGICGTPKFPVTPDYAKHQMIVHKPWRSYPTSDDWVCDFHQFINNPNAPLTAQMTYQRVHARFLSKMDGYNPTADIYDHNKNPIDMSSLELMEMLGLHYEDGCEFDDSIMTKLNKGLNYEWDKDPKVRLTAP